MSAKPLLAEFFRVVWGAGDLDALPRFWTEDCVNHAMPSADNRGLAALRAYHAHLFAMSPPSTTCERTSCSRWRRVIA